MTAVLRIVSGAGEGAEAPLIERSLTIGRDARAGLQITDPKSSRLHAELRCEHGQWMLVDLGSSNGTWNGDARIESMPLAHGATFRIGRTTIRFEQLPDAASPGETTALEIEDPQRLVGLEEGEGTGTLLSARSGADGATEARVSAYLALLHQIVLESNAARNRDELFEVLDEAAAEGLEGDRCAVFLPTPDGWTLWPAHQRRLRARYGAVPFARTLLAAVRAHGQPLLCTREGDLSPSASMVQAGVRSAMAAPLRIGQEIHALLYVDRIAGSQPFTRTDLEFLAAAANQMAITLHNRELVATLEAEVERLQASPPAAALALVWKDPLTQEVDAFIVRAGPVEAPVLLRGEPGTGKELVARLVHQHSRRAARPLTIVACAALESPESALFGRVMPGGDPRPGLVELADQGTIYLDDIDALPLPVQATLIGVLDRGEFPRSGDGALRRVDVRVIAGTSRDLAEDVHAGRMRAELLARLDVLSLQLPPLRSRPGDIEALAEHFLQEAARRLNRPVQRLAPEARSLLLRYSWPGNVRQLRNILERACVLATGVVIRVQDLPETLRVDQSSPAAAGPGPITTLAEIERVHIQRVLEHCGGNKKATAEILGIDRSTLYAKLRQYGQA